MLHHKKSKIVQTLLSKLFFLYTLLLVACQPPSPSDPNKQCVNFKDRREGEEVPAQYHKDGFIFETLNGQKQHIYLTATPNELGLRISPDGIKVALPQPTSQADLRLVSYHSSDSMEVTAYDKAGDVVDRGYVPATLKDTVQLLSLFGQEISELTILGGAGDGVLLEICIK